MSNFASAMLPPPVSDEPLSAAPPSPGLVLIFSVDSPMLQPIALDARGRIIGRDDAGGLPLQDERVSREHVEVAFSGGEYIIRDLGSRNGTYLDGHPITRPLAVKH